MESFGMPLGNIEFRRKLLSTILLLARVFALVEICCYCAIFYQIFKNNKLNRANLPKKEITSRKNKNVVTLTGQVVSFIMESFTLMIVQVVSRSSNESKLVETSFSPIYLIIAVTVISISYFFSSHELKRHYNISIISVIPNFKSILDTFRNTRK